ncbi:MULTISPECIES: NYN domain-containing protein [Cyanophyceae]|uniref:NYN domain-containing protein n=1 Tax=Leptolyngbya subtilissima DQ-A4 TaxID=2933933 RepID=A0ABV0KA78_9CYAN|nr:NYN domain-containing protein [Nodosilinea sp. FACHB-141]MBD2115185.1 NYN domain-containing protein [Nodosilinea sp. FACHB-141]
MLDALVVAIHDSVVALIAVVLSRVSVPLLLIAQQQQRQLKYGPRGRIYLAVDNPNILAAARENSVHVYFDKVLRQAGQGTKGVAEAHFFTQAFGISAEHERFLQQIESAGYTTIKALPGRPKNGKQHPDIDCLLITDILAHPERFDTCVVLSGDLDYLHAFRYLRSLGKRVEVWGFPNSTSQEIKDEVDAFVDLRTLPGVCKPRQQ